MYPFPKPIHQRQVAELIDQAGIAATELMDQRTGILCQEIGLTPCYAEPMLHV